MKRRIAAIVVVGLSIGVTAWALYEKHDTERFMLSMLYLDSTTHIRNDLYLLSKLREGQTQEAMTRLEQLLQLQMATLEGCKFDLCAQSTPTLYADALEAAKAYHRKYPSQ
jgi:hypothetical protein